MIYLDVVPLNKYFHPNFAILAAFISWVLLKHKPPSDLGLQILSQAIEMVCAFGLYIIFLEGVSIGIVNLG